MNRSNRRPESFDSVAKLYDRARPNYPTSLIQDLIDKTSISTGTRILEIGPGTGHLSKLFVDKGASLTAVELGPNLAQIARQRLKMYPQAEVVTSSFEDWEPPNDPFDLVVAATTFHWLDPKTRLAEVASALRSGGYLAIVETHWGVGPVIDKFSIESQRCYERWDPHHDKDFVPPTIADLPISNAELEQSADFTDIEFKLYEAPHTYSAASYVDLLGTFSNILGLENEARTGLLNCLGELINAQFNGRIVRNDAYSLWTARRS